MASKLAALRYDANLAIDGPFADVAARVEDAILRHAIAGPDGVPRLSLVGAAMASMDVRMMLADITADLTLATAYRIAAAEALAERTATEARR